jgi:hypothetical protein
VKRSRCALILMCILVAGGCAVSEAGRYPNLVAEELGPVSLDDVNLVFEERTRGRRETAGALYDSFMRAAKEVNGATVDSSQHSPYRLRIAARRERSGMAWMLIDLFGFALLLPSVVTNAAILEGELSRDGIVMGTFEASGGTSTVYWLPLLPFFPIIMFSNPDQEEILDETYRDLFIAVSRELNTR